MNSTTFAHYDALVHKIYDAALEPSRWPVVMAKIAEAAGASHSLLYTPVHTPEQGGFLFPHNIPQTTLDLWAARGIHEDPLVAAAKERGYIDRGEGVAMTGNELMPEAELLATDFYRDLWAPIDIAKVCSGMVFDGTDTHKLPTILAVYRRLLDAPFDEHQVNLIQRLLSHVSRSLGVMFHLRDRQLQAASSLGALDRLAAGVFLLSQDLSVQFANSAGKSLLDVGGPLRLTSAGQAGGLGKLELSKRLTTMEREFQKWLRDAVATSTLTPAHFSRAMILPDAAGRPACVLNASPLGNAPRFRVDKTPPSAIVFAYDVASAGSVPPEKLCDLFALTPAEARAAMQIMSGGSTSDMADRLGISVNTVKTQLKAAYGKTGTNRHADLLRLLLALSSNQ